MGIPCGSFFFGRNFFSRMWLIQANSLLILSAAFFMLHHVEGGKISAKGCFQDVKKNRALPELLHNFRGGELKWRDLGGTVISKCQKLAENKNYKCFGIQFYGECWSGEFACNSFDIHGRADNCLCSGSGYIPYDYKKPGECVEPVGGNLSNFVYEIKG